METETLKRFDRLVAILIQLQSKRVVKAQELADRFEVSLRTVYRDLRSLEEAGVPLYGEAGVGYSLVEGYRLPPVMFTKEEANSFVAAEKLVKQFTDKGFGNSFESAIFKIKSVLRDAEKDRIAALESHILIGGSHKPFNDSVPNALELIFESLTEKKQLILNYQSLQNDRPEIRNIEPVGLFHENQFWYIMAYCHLRRDYRQFRLDRIHGITRSDKPFSRSHGSLEEYRKKENGGGKIRVRIQIEKKIARYLKHDRHFYGFVSESDTGDTVEMIFMTRDIEEGFPRWYLMFGDYARILEPEILKDRVKEIISRTSALL